MAIPPRFLNELRDRLTLSEIIGKRLKIDRAGREFKACCPFHKEKTPSFTINDEKQFYHCFGCGAHGDALNFVIQNDNISFIDAVEMLAAEAGMKVPQQTPQEIVFAKQQKSLHELLDKTASFFQKTLMDSKNRDAQRYLNDRGITREQIENFRIGFAPADGDALRAYLEAQGFSAAQMIEAGVCNQSKKGPKPYAFFRDRVMFPVADRRGRVVAFGGRILPEHMRPPPSGNFKPPKYINSADTPLFHKGRMLYSESRARQAAAQDQPIIVVEGYLDVIACAGAGFAGAVAPLGTALTEDQIEVIWKMIPQDEKIPVLCFDGDNAGRSAASRACERILPLLKANQTARFAFLPDGQDPDSLIRADGRKAFAKVIESAIPLSEFIWTHHTTGKSFETPESRAGLSKTLDDETSRIQDANVQRYYKQVFKDKLYHSFRGGSFSKGKYGGNNRGGGFQKKTEMVAGLRRPVFSANVMATQMVLAAAINHPYLIGDNEEFLAQMLIEHERLDLLRQAVLNLFATIDEIDSQGYKRELSALGFERELNDLFSEKIYTHAAFCRPKCEREKVIEEWDGLIETMRRNQEIQEWKRGWGQVGEGFDPETESRTMALKGTIYKEESS